MRLRGSSGDTDEGTWEVTDDGQWCRQWKGDAQKACFIYFKKGDEYEYWYSDRSRMSLEGRFEPIAPNVLHRPVRPEKQSLR